MAMKGCTLFTFAPKFGSLKWSLVDPLEGGTLSKQPADLRSLEMALFRARQIAEELEDVAVLYFIDMAIAEAKMKSPPTANNHEP
jgi:hypothetical protein